jgi:hypothetical protein
LAGIERRAVDILHHHEVDAIERVNLVDGDDIRVIQSRSGLGLLHEAALAVRIGHLFGRQEFDGDEAVQARVPRFVHHTHATLADLFEQLVVAECPVRHERPGEKYT